MKKIQSSVLSWQLPFVANAVCWKTIFGFFIVGRLSDVDNHNFEISHFFSLFIKHRSTEVQSRLWQ